MGHPQIQNQRPAHPSKKWLAMPKICGIGYAKADQKEQMKASDRIRRMTLSVVAAACLCSQANATSIIIDVKSNRVLMLVDSRAEQSNPGGNSVRDDKCKIVVLGEQVFVETGSEGYTPEGPFDSVPEFHGTDEAVKAYSKVDSNDLHAIALAWAIDVSNNFARFYVANPGRVRELASQGKPLLLGYFAGEDDSGVVKAYEVQIVLDDSLMAREGASIPIGYAIGDLPPRDEPYSTDPVTREFLDLKTDRATKLAKQWKKRSRHFPMAEREFRHLEFLIERTGNFDITVHGPVNAAEVMGTSSRWIQNKTCQEQSR